MSDIWHSYDGGRTFGEIGSENGIIVEDEAYGDGVRITLERESPTAPFAITCGIGGWMVHTRYFSTEGEARNAYNDMKYGLVRTYDVIPGADDPESEAKIGAVIESIHAFIRQFP